MSTAEDTAAQQEDEALAPVSFRLSTHWKLAKGQYGITHADSRRISLSEALDLLLDQLKDEECSMSTEGTVTTIVIDWSKVPEQIRNPFRFGVRR